MGFRFMDHQFLKQELLNKTTNVKPGCVESNIQFFSFWIYCRINFGSLCRLFYCKRNTGFNQEHISLFKSRRQILVKFTIVFGCEYKQKQHMIMVFVFILYLFLESTILFFIPQMNTMEFQKHVNVRQ